jgi:hypothetical protein
VRKGTCLRFKQEESGKGPKWRDADPNRGDHDFQPRCPSIGSSGICRTNAKNLAAFDGNVKAIISKPRVHAALAHFLAPHASLSTPHILSVPGLEADQIQDITGECEDSIQFTAYGLIRSSIVHFGHYLNLEQASLSSAI